jgi:anti-anti-sigma factor
MKHHAGVVDRTPTSPARPAGLVFNVDRRDHEARLAVAGELDLATQDSLRRAAADVLRPPIRALLLDLGEVTFCGAAGVSSLMAIRSLAADAEIRLVLTGVQPPVRRVLDMLGVASLIPVAHTRTFGRVGLDRDTARARKGWRGSRLGRRARAA